MSRYESLGLQARYNVELEIILPRDMTVQESHDLSLELQHKVSIDAWNEEDLCKSYCSCRQTAQGSISGYEHHES